MRFPVERLTRNVRQTMNQRCYSVSFLAIGLLVASCSRSNDYTAAELVGVYEVENANSVWAKNADYTEQDVAALRVELRLDGSANLTNFPLGRKATGFAKWSFRKPDVIDLLVIEQNKVVPIGLVRAKQEVRLTYSDDPELPANLILRKRSSQSTAPQRP